MYSVAKAFHQRPADLLGIDDEWAAWCMDEVVWSWGVHVEAEMRKAEKTKDSSKGAQKRLQDQKAAENRVEAKLKELLGTTDEAPAPTRPAGKPMSFT